MGVRTCVRTFETALTAAVSALAVPRCHMISVIVMSYLCKVSSMQSGCGEGQKTRAADDKDSVAARKAKKGVMWSTTDAPTGEQGRRGLIPWT